MHGTHAAHDGRLPVTAAILAGGRSRRMGTDKALLEIGGVPLVARVAASLSADCSRVIVVAGDAEAIREAGLPDDVAVVSDAVPFQGPLGGLSTALRAAETAWCFAAGVDMPFIDGGVVRVLCGALIREIATGGDPQMVMPIGDDGPEPLLALYRHDCCDAIDAVLAEGSHKVADLLGRVRCTLVPVEELRACDPGLMSLVNVNTAEDLERARWLAEQISAGEKPLGGCAEASEVASTAESGGCD